MQVVEQNDHRSFSGDVAEQDCEGLPDTPWQHVGAPRSAHRGCVEAGEVLDEATAQSCHLVVRAGPQMAVEHLSPQAEGRGRARG